VNEATSLEGLRALQRAVYERSGRNVPIVFGLGDVGALLLRRRAGSRQVCFETGAYDGWDAEDEAPMLTDKTDMTLEEAVEWLLAEPQKGDAE
jgi:hypothetical protein